MLEQSDLQAIGTLIDERLDTKLDKRFGEFEVKIDKKFDAFEVKLEQKLNDKFQSFKEEIVSEVIDGVGGLLDRHDEEIELIKINYVTKSQLKVALEDLERKIA